MNKKSIILCISVIAVLFVGVAVAVFFLYSDTSARHSDEINVDMSDRAMGFYGALPSDAIAVIRFDSARNLATTLAGDNSESTFPVFSSNSRFRTFLDRLSRTSSRQLSGVPAMVSIHSNTTLDPLLVMDVARAGSQIPEWTNELLPLADSLGLVYSYVDGSALTHQNSYLSKRTLLLVSTSDVLVNSSQRHITKGVSVLDANGFVPAALSMQEKECVLVSNENAGKVISAVFSRSLRKYSDFIRRCAEWTCFSIDKFSDGKVILSGEASFNGGNEFFMNVLSSVSNSSVTSILPSYTIFAATLPLQDVSEYIKEYEKFSDAKKGIGRYRAKQKSLAVDSLPHPEKWAENLAVKEVAIGSFRVDSSVETVLLLRCARPDAKLIFGDASVSLKGYQPRIHDFRYKGYAASLFGSLYSLKDESCCTFKDGWIIAGSRNAVQEYVSGRASEVSLESYLSDAGLEADTKNASFLSYLSFTEDERVLSDIFSKEASSVISESFDGVAFAPAFLKVGKSGLIEVTLERVNELKTSAPVFERDTVVTIPKGPFKVKNSGTGRMNNFSQLPNNFLSLKEEDGKGIWSVEFSSPICGCASTIDYYANGKLQILFASGSKLYLLDRLGRFVSGFPVSLGKEVLIGPDVYDFNAARKYNVMVLHTDNTIAMYNLKGKTPEQWKGITASETIKYLPEMLKVSGKTYWVVRTSIRTLIFPFYGGEPLVSGEGDDMIRPDSAITPVEGKSAVKATTYTGKSITIELK